MRGRAPGGNRAAFPFTVPGDGGDDGAVGDGNDGYEKDSNGGRLVKDHHGCCCCLSRKEGCAIHNKQKGDLKKWF